MTSALSNPIERVSHNLAILIKVISLTTGSERDIWRWSLLENSCELLLRKSRSRASIYDYCRFLIWGQLLTLDRRG